jgi:hypothetical protein
MIARLAWHQPGFAVDVGFGLGLDEGDDGFGEEG